MNDKVLFPRGLFWIFIICMRRKKCRIFFVRGALKHPVVAQDNETSSCWSSQEKHEFAIYWLKGSDCTNKQHKCCVQMHDLVAAISLLLLIKVKSLASVAEVNQRLTIIIKFWAKPPTPHPQSSFCIQRISRLWWWPGLPCNVAMMTSEKFGK